VRFCGAFEELARIVLGKMAGGDFLANVNRFAANIFTMSQGLEIVHGLRTTVKCSRLQHVHRDIRLGNIPSARHVQNWLRRERAAQAPPVHQPGDMDLTLPTRETRRRDDTNNPRVPDKLKMVYEPEQLIHALDFQMGVRNVDDFEETLQAGHDYVSYMRGIREEEWFDVSSIDNPSSRTLGRSLLVLDAVSSIFERREWAAVVKNPETLESMHLFADGSPVTGHEVQGMLVDMCWASGAVTRRVLVAAGLTYGRCSAVDKLLALLWAAWLTAGPDEAAFLLFLSFFTSATTDLGTESHMLDLPDLGRAFFKTLCGVPIAVAKDLIDAKQSSLGHAMLLPGWGHLIGNLAKFACHSAQGWPETLTHIRNLSKFYRNGTWREHLAKTFPGDPCTSTLETTKFVSFAKWRYATVVEAIGGLLKVRSLSTKLDVGIFKNTQEQKLINSVVQAGGNRPLWRWMRAMYDHVLHHLERLRRWGMVCDCCSDERRRRRLVFCKRSGRRLGNAQEHVRLEIAAWKDRANNLVPEQVEGDRALLGETVQVIRRVADMLWTKFQWLWMLPYMFVHAATQAGAADCLVLLDRYPMLEQTATAQWWNRNLRGDLEAVRDGAAPSARLALEVKRLENSPLVEDPGEGYHRGTTHEHVRAPSGSREHLIAVQRRAQNLARIKRILKDKLGKNKAVLNFEWRNFKRVLNKPIDRKHMFRRVLMRDRPFWRKFYRLDSADSVEDSIYIWMFHIYK